MCLKSDTATRGAKHGSAGAKEVWRLAGAKSFGGLKHLSVGCKRPTMRHLAGNLPVYMRNGPPPGGASPPAAWIQHRPGGPQVTFTSLQGPSAQPDRVASALAALPIEPDQHLPPITVREVKWALSKFSRSTAVGADRWKPHDLLLLSTTGLTLLT